METIKIGDIVEYRNPKISEKELFLGEVVDIDIESENPYKVDLFGEFRWFSKGWWRKREHVKKVILEKLLAMNIYKPCNPIEE